MLSRGLGTRLIMNAGIDRSRSALCQFHFKSVANGQEATHSPEWDLYMTRITIETLLREEKTIFALERIM